MRLIDADALKDSLRESFDACDLWADGAKDEETRIRADASKGTFLEAILRTNDMPTVDPVIRCKDCIYGDVPKLCYRKNDIYCARYEIFHDRDFYCADGMKKDGDGK